MLIIRKEQMEVFEQAARIAFEERMIAHLRKSFPKKCDDIGDEGVRASIQDAVDRTRKLGVALEYDIERYINHMYALGFDFDTNPDYCWVKQILSDPAIDPSDLMEVLSERTQQELEKHAAGGEEVSR